MQIYYYDRKTGEYSGRGKAEKDPVASRKQGKDVFIIPAFAITLKPPDYKKNEVAVFKNGNWALKPDFRGQKFYDPETLEEVEITAIGQKIPKKALRKKPAKPSKFHAWQNREYVFNLKLYENYALDLLNEKRNQPVTITATDSGGNTKNYEIELKQEKILEMLITVKEAESYGLGSITLMNPDTKAREFNTFSSAEISKVENLIFPYYKKFQKAAVDIQNATSKEEIDSILVKLKGE